LTKGQTLRVYDLQGKLVSTMPVKSVASATAIGNTIGKKLPPGIYIARQGASVSFKIMGFGR